MLGLGEWESIKPPKELAPRFIFGLMRFYATNCREKATEFGKLLRKVPPLQNREMINCLLLEVWRTTGKYHDKELAQLLTIAFEAVGSKKYFTIEQIKKHRQKHVVPRIKLYKELHPNASPLVAAENGKTRTP
jgi:hypothetical protein